MAARDRYSIDMRCESCKTACQVHLSENDYPFMRDADRRVDGVAGPIRAYMEDRDLVVECTKCSSVLSKKPKRDKNGLIHLDML